MKKKLVVLLAVVMMFAFSASAYAAVFSDMDEQPVLVQDSVAKAVALGIIDGYEDGTFGPGQTITRAEFAKIAVTAAGAKDTATMLEKNASSFKDVKANSWYTGWINAGESLGIFLGDPNGNFRPNDTISNQEVVTVMMRLLGYNDNLTGTWPVNYVTKANQIHMLDDVTIVATAPATRADVAVMLDAALDTWIVTYDKDTNEFVYKQTTKSGSSYITLLDDSFDGQFVEVNAFPKVDQLRDANAKTLNWTVPAVVTTSTTNPVTGVVTTTTANRNTTFIIDGKTVVSHNGSSLFDLEGHQGKVYYVVDKEKTYARFIEVESYVKTVTDDVKYDQKNSKVSVLKTNYNAYYDVLSDVNSAAVADGYEWKSGNLGTAAPTYNSNVSLYFNDDDQVYLVRSDKLFTDKSFFVKTVGTNTVRLVGDKTKTINMKDGDALIYDKATETFVTPSELKAGDALIEVKEGDLYVRVEAVTGKLARSTGSANTLKYNLAGKNYLVENPNLYDKDFEDAGITVDDVYGNDVKFILNKDNTVAAIIADETSIGTTLYGIVTDKTGSNSGYVQSITGLSIFTSEGKTVSYDFDDDLDSGTMASTNVLGRLVAYKLNKDNEIKSLNIVGSGSWKTGDIGTQGAGSVTGSAPTTQVQAEIKNNAYLQLKSGVDAADLSLASNVVIFEVGSKNNDKEVDPTIVTRSSLLSKSSFETEGVTFGVAPHVVPGLNYLAYDTNSSGAIKALAYTTAGSNDLHYGIVATWNFESSEYSGADRAITFKGDDTVYQLTNTNGIAGKNGQLIIYKLSGEKVTPVANFAKQGFETLNRGNVGYVAGNNSGLISFQKEDTNVPGLGNDVMFDFRNAYVKPALPAGKANVYDVMTDSNTLVFVVDAVDGSYSEGSLSDISRGSWAYVPVIDKDGYADVVIIDDYGTYKDDKWNKK